MNLYALIPLAAFLVNSFTWITIFAQKRRSRVNQAYLLFATIISLWVAHDYLAWSPVPDLWHRGLVKVDALCWLTLGFLFLNFTYVFLERRKDYPFWVSLCLVVFYVPLSLATDLIYSGYEPTFYGVRKTIGPLYGFAVVTNAGLPIVYALALVFRRYRSTKDRDLKHQLRLLLLGASSTLLLAWASDVVLPHVFGVKVLPALGPSITVILALSVYRAVAHYNFLSVSVEEAARHLFDNARDGVILLDRNEHATLMNRAARQLLHLGSVEETYRQVAALLEQARGGRGAGQIEIEVIRDGEPRTLSVTRSSIRRSRVELGQLIILRDISARKRAEKTIREREERYRLLFNSSHDAIFVFRIDENGAVSTFEEVNDVACQLLGYGREDLLERRVPEISPPAEREKLVAAVEQLFDQGQVQLETVLLTRDGEPIPVEIDSHLFDLDGHPAVLGTVEDLSEQKTAEAQHQRLEAQLRQAQKIEAIGTLAGGLAHDMNNVLSVIMTLASVLRLESDEQDRHQRDFEEMLISCRQGRDLTQNLLGFARKGIYVKKRLSLNRLVGDVVDVLKRTIPPKILLETRLQPKLRLFEGDPNQITHALMNVCLNAVDAIGESGTLTISSEQVTLAASDHAFPSLEPGTYVRLRVIDTGVGMDEATIERAFEPFFSTKTRGRGTGLGLAMVYGTVAEHGGIVTLDSSPGKGTTATIDLPALPEGEVETETTDRMEIPQIERRGTVLLVDDEEMIRTAGQRLLETLGYRALLAEDGAEAVDLYRQHGEEIILVLLDMVMPVMDGVETFIKLSEIDPKVRVLLTSGHTIAKKAEQLLSKGAKGFVQKPYTLDTLATEMHQALK
jgi:PAS domain S-box-containing protein